MKWAAGVGADWLDKQLGGMSVSDCMVDDWLEHTLLPDQSPLSRHPKKDVHCLDVNRELIMLLHH